MLTVRCGDTLPAKPVQTFHTEIISLFYGITVMQTYLKKCMAALLLIYFVLYVSIKQSFFMNHLFMSLIFNKRNVLKLSLKYGHTVKLYFNSSDYFSTFAATKRSLPELHLCTLL